MERSGDLKKLAIAFSALLLLLIVIAGISYHGISEILNKNRNSKNAVAMHELFTNRILDHYRWLAAVDQVLLDSKRSRLSVQTDDHRCSLGEWLFGNERKTAESVFPALVPLLSKLEGPHARLHESAKAIDAILAGRDGSDHASVTAKAMDIHQRQTMAAMDALGKVMEEISLFLEQESDTAAEQLLRTSHDTETEVVVIALVALVAGVLLSLSMTRYITTHVSKLTDFTVQMAKGDFTGDLDIDSRTKSVGWRRP